MCELQVTRHKFASLRREVGPLRLLPLLRSSGNPGVPFAALMALTLTSLCFPSPALEDAAGNRSNNFVLCGMLAMCFQLLHGTGKAQNHGLHPSI